MKDVYFKSILKVNTITFLSAFQLFYSSMIFIYYKNYLLSIFDIGLLFAITSITTIIFEIPFGIFADKKSLKLSIILGLIFSILGQLLFLISFNFYTFAFSNILMAIGSAGLSGSNAVLLMNLLKEKNDYFLISSRNRMIANLLGGFCIGFIFNFNPKAPFIISLFITFINLYLYLTIKDYKNEKKCKDENEEKNTNKYTIVTTLKNNFFILSIIFGCYIAIPQISIYFPEYMSILKINPIFIGYVYALSSAISLIGNLVYKRFFKKLNIEYILKISLYLLSFSSFLMFISKNIYFSLFLYAIYRFITGYIYSTFSIHISNNTEDKYKATLFSISNVIIELAFILSDPIITFIIQKYSIYYSYLFSAIIILTMSIYISYTKNKN